MGKTRRRVVPGDVFELAVRDGFAYVQLLGKTKPFGWAARVVGPIRREAVSNADATADGTDLYVVIIGDVVFEENEERLRYVGRSALPEQHRDRLPIFRANGAYLPDGRHNPDQWWLDDGAKEWRVGRLSEEQQHYPYRQFTPALALRDLIDRGWDPEWEFKANGREFAEPSAQGARSQSEVPSFFILFRDRGDAERARDEVLRAPAFTAAALDEYQDEGDAVGYVVCAKADANVNLEDAESNVKMIALAHRGDYDGKEVPVK